MGKDRVRPTKTERKWMRKTHYYKKTEYGETTFWYNKMEEGSVGKNYYKIYGVDGSERYFRKKEMHSLLEFKSAVFFNVQYELLSKEEWEWEQIQ